MSPFLQASFSARRAFSVSFLVSLFLAWSFPAAASPDGPSFSLVVEPAGFATYPFPTQGAEVAYYWNASSAISVSFAQGEREQLMTESRARLWLIRYKRLLGSASQINLGLGTRRIETEYSVRTASGEEGARAEMEVAVAEFSFGNRFAFGPLFLGCDWIGIATPLAKLSYRDDYPDDAVESKSESDAAAFGRVAFVSTLEFMRAYVGVIF